MIDKMQFTEDQVREVERIQKHAFESGLVWGFVGSLATVVGISIAVMAATRFGHLLF